MRGMCCPAASLFHRYVCTMSIGVAFKIFTLPSLSFGAAPRISFQCAVRTQVLVVTAPTSIEKALSVHFVRYYAAHVWKVGPAIASCIASLEI